ncbi:DUF4054 domain-containing protein [Metapseudomonas otitidis]|uniref:DUF4054 domain-containing protein n=1 Tax=Metapseudomonas otitidis TaxID=319939 RepID=UPI002446DF5F|nr:DUF4054 domain-containing protein [Pseudomonas otitidis]MDG9784645.1 DUF4054 domain-containing protein [Pseudomonas otitidis]
MDANQFRQDFPEFADATKYPDSAVNFWLSIAIKTLPEDRWCDYLNMGLELFVAHNLTLAAQNQAVASVGGAPGQVKGPLSSKAVDKVSAGYDSGAVTLADGGFFNLTTYGIQFLQLARMVGSGGIQL